MVSPHPGDHPVADADRQRALHALIRLAYSAERAAAYAYQGHARSVCDPAERAAIARIETEEWQHRESLGLMLKRLGLRPSWWLEWKFAAIGRVISLSCYLIGWFLPMYFAGRLESGNVNEYLVMADLAADSPIADELPCIRHMAVVEKEHEVFFLTTVAGHPWLPLFQRVFRWGPDRCRNPL